MFGALAGAIPGIIGAVMQGQAQHEQAVQEWENLQFQKQNARNQMDLATAARTDAYGNKEYYDPYSKEWKTQLAPLQKQMLAELQQEQQRTLTEDAPRARALRERQDIRSKQAGTQYQTDLADYIKNQPKTEGAYQGDMENLALLSQQDAERTAGNNLARLAVRSGQSGDALAGIVNAVARQQGAGAMSALASGRAAGSQAYNAAQQVQNSKLDRLKTFASLMDDISSYTPKDPTTAADLTQMQRDSLSSISQALANQSNQMQGAYSSLGSALGRSPDLSGIADSLSKLGDLKDIFGGGSLNAPIVSGGTGSGGDTGLGLGERTNIPLPRPRPNPPGYYNLGGGYDYSQMDPSF